MEVRYTGSADIYVTEKCNENCLFCSAQKGSLDVNFNDFKLYVDNWIKYGIKHINITGGEPLLNPNLINLLDYACSKGMDIALFTNGLLLKEVNYSAILSKIKWFAISIDGDKISNEILGRNENHYENALETLHLVRAVAPNVKVRIATVVTRNNQDEIIKLGEDLVKRNIIPDLWRIKQLIPVRKALENWDYLSLGNNDYEKFVAELVRLYGQQIIIKPNKWKSKSGDLIVTYPSGASGVTIISDSGNNSEVVSLGNIFNDFNGVLSKWVDAIKSDKSAADNYMEEAWNKF